MDTQLLLTDLINPTLVFFLLGGMAHFHIPLALGSTFPFNITVGMPVYLELIMRTP